MLSPLDEWRALPAPLQLEVVAALAAEHGPQAVAALRWQVEAHRRPVQRIPGLDDLCEDGQPWRVMIISGEFGSGKTQLATWITLRAILDWRVERPRIIAATADTVREDLVNHDAPSGLLAWLPPWVSREWLPATGRAGRLTIDGVRVSLLSADAGASTIGSAAGWVLFDDYAKCSNLLGAERAEEALANAFRSLRSSPGRMVLPTTPDGAQMAQDIAGGEGMRGVVTLDLGRTEDNLALPPAALDFAQGLRKMNLWTTEGGGAFAHIQWPKLRVREAPQLRRAIVFIDPAKSQRSHACKVGIVATGIDGRSIVYGLADRSAQRPPDGPQGWPAATLDLAEEIEDRFGLPPDSVELGIECNTLGQAGPELLRAEERARNGARGRAAVALRKVHVVTSRPRDPKTRRAAPVVNMAEGNQVRMLGGLGELESSLSGLTDASTKADAADSFVHGARILVGEKSMEGIVSEEEAAAQCALAAVLTARIANGGRPTEPVEIAPGILEPMKVEGASPGDSRAPVVPPRRGHSSWRTRGAL